MRSALLARLNSVTAVALRIYGPITRADLDPLSARCCLFFAAHPGAAVECDVAGIGSDAVTVDALARLQLVAKKNDCTVVLLNAGSELRDLVELMGLTEVLLGSV
jgi:ABC-type transporter Mla MlaB component